MVPAIATGPTGLASPAAVSSPPPSSDSPAAVAVTRPGRSPSRSKPAAVGSRPWPPKVPNSFCAPCAARYPPTTVRLASSAMSRMPIVSSAFPYRGRVQNSGARFRLREADVRRVSPLGEQLVELLPAHLPVGQRVGRGPQAGDKYVEVAPPGFGGAPLRRLDNAADTPPGDRHVGARGVSA